MGKRLCLLGMLGAMLLSGCGTPAKYVDAGGADALITVSGVDAADWNRVAAKAVDSLLSSGAFRAANKEKPVVMISRIRNYTMLHLDTAILTGKIRQAIMSSKQAVVTSAVGSGTNLDLAVRRIREKELDDLFAIGTVPPRGTVIAPDFSLSGLIVQQCVQSGRTEESYFLFHLVLTDLKTGVAVWEFNTDFSKQATRSVF